MECPVCRANFGDATLLAQHLIATHAAGKKRKIALENNGRAKKARLDVPVPDAEAVADAPDGQQNRLLCADCGKTFANAKTLRQHKRNVHDKLGFVSCAQCGKKFPDAANLRRHMRIHDRAPTRREGQAMRFECHECGEDFTTAAELQAHEDKLHAGPSAPQAIPDNVAPKGKFKCARCGSGFPRREKLRKHMKVHAPQPELQKPKERDPLPVDPRIDDADGLADILESPEMETIYRSNWKWIRSRTIPRGFTTEYRLRLPNETTPSHYLSEVFLRQRNAFLLNVRLGFTMVNIETDEVRFFYSSNNTELFPDATRISSREDFQEFMQRFGAVDLEEHCRQQRPNSKWVFLFLASLSAMVTSTSDPIRAGHIVPRWIRKHKGVISLDSDEHHNTPYKDGLCMFRCLALHRGADIHAVNEPAKALCRQWMNYMQIDECRGVGDLELDDFERCFDVAINAYELVPMVEPRKLEEDEELEADDFEEQIRQEEARQEAIKQRKFTVQLVRRTSKQVPESEVMNVNLFASPDGKVHASFITDLAVFANSFQCKKCLRTFPQSVTCGRHEKNCNGAATVEEFKGNGYCLKPTLFERLEDFGVVVPAEMRFHPHQISFDFESTALPKDVVEFFPIPQTGASLPDETDGNSFSPVTGKYRISNPDMDDAKEFVRAVAEMQKTRFELCVQLEVLKNGKQSKRKMVKQLICCEDDLQKALWTFDLSLIETLCGDFDVQALEIKVAPSKQDFVAECVPASCAIATNIEGYDENGKPKPVFLLSDGDPQKLVDKFVETLEEMSAASGRILAERYCPYVQQLEEKIEAYAGRVKAAVDAMGGMDNKESRSKLSIEERRDYFQSRKNRKDMKALLKQLKKWIRTTTVLGFNSQKFDLNLIRPYLLKLLAPQNPKIIKRNGSYMQIKTDTLNFLDICNYLSAGTSYSKMLRAYGVEEAKSFWPHDIFTSLDFLKTTHLPPKEAYYSALKGCGISDKDYADLQALWVRQGFENMAQMLAHYNKLDVGPFLEAVAQMRKFWQDEGLEMFASSEISQPGLALRRMMMSLPQHVNFVLPDEKHKDQFYKLRDNMVGGPSIVYHRCHIAGQTRIHEAENGKICKKILGFDANALYLSATMSQLPTGIPKIYKLEEDGRFHGKRMYKYAQAELEWLEYESLLRGEKIRHRFNYGQQVMVEGTQVDGYIPSKRQVFFFDGCWFHAHICYLTGKRGPSSPDWHERRKKDFAIRKRLTSLGYEVIVKTECDWETMKKTDAQLREFRKKFFALPSHGGPMTTDKLVQEVRRGRFFGTVTCSLNVPEHLRPYFDMFPAIFKNSLIRKEDLRGVMLEHVEKHDLMRQPRRTLVASFHTENQMFATPYLKWLIEHGVEVTKIESATEYKAIACFEEFGNKIADARREADKDPSKAILAEMRKLIGNSCYGKLATAVDRHKDVRVCNDKTVRKYIRSPFVSNVEDVADDCAEVTLRKKKIVHDLYNVMSFFVYNYAKLRLLEFVFDFIDHFVSREDFQIMETDTDSVYMAITATCLNDIIKPELRDDYEREKHKFLPRDGEWKKYDERTPGLFKLEATGDAMICLNSKTYYLLVKDGKDKLSTKGMQKHLNAVKFDDFLAVLETQMPHSGIARGIKMMKDKNLGIYRIVSKDVFTYTYIKREILRDGVSTRTYAHI